jgi:hypothetical protein
MVVASPPIPRSRIAIGIDPALRPRMAGLSEGRTLAIDFFVARLRTSVVVGDLSLRWLDTGPEGEIEVPDGLAALATIEGVGLVADARLLELLATTGPTIVEGGPPFARHLALRLDDSAAWIEFLETPVARRRRSLS